MSYVYIHIHAYMYIVAVKFKTDFFYLTLVLAPKGHVASVK